MKKIALSLFMLGIIHFTHAELPPHQKQATVEIDKRAQEYLDCIMREATTLKNKQKFLEDLEMRSKKAAEIAQKLSQECNASGDIKTCQKYQKAEKINRELKRDLFILTFDMEPAILLGSEFGLVKMIQLMQQMQQE